MTPKTYRQIRALIAVFISLLVSIAVTQDNQVLAVVAVLTGMLFMILVRTKTKLLIDEREKAVGEKSARLTYAIFAPTLGLGSVFLVFLGRDNPYLFSLGQTLSYLTLYLIALYSFCHFIINKRMGGTSDEE